MKKIIEVTSLLLTLSFLVTPIISCSNKAETTPSTSDSASDYTDSETNANDTSANIPSTDKNTNADSTDKGYTDYKRRSILSADSCSFI